MNDADLHDHDGRPIATRWRHCFRFWNQNYSDVKYIAIVRDPREIIVSGYLYHRACTERWAVTSGLNFYGPWPTSHFLRSETRRHRQFIEAGQLGDDGTYQTRLNSLGQDEGLMLEMESVGRLTISGMYDFSFYEQPNVMTVKFEDLVFDPERAVTGLLSFLGVDTSVARSVVERFVSQTPAGMDLATRHANPHITNKESRPERFRDYWTSPVAEHFARTFPADVLERLGYR